jgi:hypothetical protein
MEGVFALHLKCNPKGEPHDVANEPGAVPICIGRKSSKQQAAPSRLVTEPVECAPAAPGPFSASPEIRPAAD